MQTLMEPQEIDLSDICTREADVIYDRKHGMALTMDVYTPKQTNGAGIIQVISGGLWSGPEYRRMPPYMQHTQALLASGYVVFAVIHRSQPMYTLYEIQEDLPRAIRYIRHHARQFDVEPDRLGITGLSSGGHLALLAATMPSKPDARDPVDAESSKVQAVVAYFPNTDLLNYGQPGKMIYDHFREQGLNKGSGTKFREWDESRGTFVDMSDGECRAVLRQTSPIAHVTEDDPPTLLIHGDSDQLVPIQQSQIFERQMKEVGAECTLITMKGQEHGWDAWLPNEKEQVIAWFDRHLRGN
jgi:acetyl esterase/lipase